MMGLPGQNATPLLRQSKIRIFSAKFHANRYHPLTNHNSVVTASSSRRMLLATINGAVLADLNVDLEPTTIVNSVLGE